MNIKVSEESTVSKTADVKVSKKLDVKVEKTAAKPAVKKAPFKTKRQLKIKKSNRGASANAIRIKLSAYEADILSVAVLHIDSCVKNAGANIQSLLRLPTKKTLITVNRGPHIDKKARDQFFLKEHTVSMTVAMNEQVRGALSALELPAGVDISLG